MLRGVAGGGESRREVGRHGVAPDVRRGTKPSNYPDHPSPYVGGYNRVRAQSRRGGTRARSRRCPARVMTRGISKSVPLCGMNYAVKSSFLPGFLKSVPEVSAKLKEPRTAERKFEEVVKNAEQAAVLVLVY